MQYEILSRGAPSAREAVECCHDGSWRVGRSAGTSMMGSLSTQIVFVPPAKRDGVFVGRRMRKVACATAGPPHDSSSRRFLHKRSRHQQPPFKGFPACHEGESESHRNHLERQKARAFDFSCGDEEPSTSPNHDAMDNINNHSDEYWSARILTEVHAFSFTGCNTINCCCMSWYYPNWIPCILECFQPSLRLWGILYEVCIFFSGFNTHKSLLHELILFHLDPLHFRVFPTIVKALEDFKERYAFSWVDSTA